MSSWFRKLRSALAQLAERPRPHPWPRICEFALGMRALAILGLAACTGTESDPDVERLDDLLAKTEIDCGALNLQSAPACGSPDVEALQLLACMNDALAT